MRGCDWRRIFVRSDTVSSASPSNAKMRRRVSSPAARNAAWSALKSNGADAAIVGPVPTFRHKHIKISLCDQIRRRKGRAAEVPQERSLLHLRTAVGRVEDRDA